MNKKSLLFVIHRLDAGGAEKSLVSLLNSLPLNQFNIDLMSVDPTGIFRSQVPSSVHIIDTPRELICQFTKISDKRFWRCATLKLCAVKMIPVTSSLPPVNRRSYEGEAKPKTALSSPIL